MMLVTVGAFFKVLSNCMARCFCLLAIAKGCLFSRIMISMDHVYSPI